MIAKRVEFRNAHKSRFSKLVAYITNAQGKNERVGEIRITNCQSEQPAWAAKEAELIQSKNTRTRMDKTYHLLLSFREGDHPSPEAMHAIEMRVCEALGYQEHQRVSAVHYDTDHTHIHLAINKIHPQRYTAHEPYFDKKNLGVLCQALEKDYNLAADNHIARMTPGEAKAQDMEKSAGIESLIGWIKRGCLPELLAASSWDELHKILGKNSLTLSERGNGLVITAKNGITAKASSINRNFSKHALEKRLGVFQPAAAHATNITACYEALPMASKIDTRQLWALYQHERLQQAQRHSVLQERAKHRRDRRIEGVKKTAQAKRAVIKPTKGRLAKAVLHHSVSDSLRKELNTIHQDYQGDWRAIYAKGKHVTWYDWLKTKAWEGNAEALEVLRHRYDRAPERGNAIAGVATDRVNERAGAKIEAVTKRGTLHYQVAQTVLRDDGKLLRLSEQVSQEVVDSALTMAVQRFGRQLAITGTEAFRQQAVAAGAKLNVVFADHVMEQQRLALIASNAHTNLPAGNSPGIPRSRGRRL
jgi:hypothetical protein